MLLKSLSIRSISRWIRRQMTFDGVWSGWKLTWWFRKEEYPRWGAHAGSPQNTLIRREPLAIGWTLFPHAFCLHSGDSWVQQKSCSMLFPERPASSHHFQWRRVPRCNKVRRNGDGDARALPFGAVDLRRLWRVEASRSITKYAAPYRIQVFQRGHPSFHTHRPLHSPRVSGLRGYQVLLVTQPPWGT